MKNKLTGLGSFEGGKYLAITTGQIYLNHFVVRRHKCVNAVHSFAFSTFIHAPRSSHFCFARGRTDGNQSGAGGGGETHSVATMGQRIPGPREKNERWRVCATSVCFRP